MFGKNADLSCSVEFLDTYTLQRICKDIISVVIIHIVTAQLKYLTLIYLIFIM